MKKITLEHIIYGALVFVILAALAYPLLFAKCGMEGERECYINHIVRDAQRADPEMDYFDKLLVICEGQVLEEETAGSFTISCPAKTGGGFVGTYNKTDGSTTFTRLLSH